MTFSCRRILFKRFHLYISLIMILIVCQVQGYHGDNTSVSNLNEIPATNQSPTAGTNLPSQLLTENISVLQAPKTPLNNANKSAIYQATDAKLLFPYRTYRDVQILYYSIPELTYLASWRLESNTTESSRCKPKKISFQLRHGGYPIVNPESSSFPSNMYLERNVFTSVTFDSDKPPTYLTITAPIPGDWFAVAYIIEDTEKIVQKGLFTVCQAWLHTNVKYFTDESVITLLPAISLNNVILQTDQFYRFFTIQNIWSAEITISKCNSENSSNTSQNSDGCPLVIYSRPLALPLGSVNETSVNCTLADETTDCKLEVATVEDGWNYILVKLLTTSEVHFEITVNTAACQVNNDNSFEVADVPQYSSSKMPKFLKPKSITQRSVDSQLNESSEENALDPNLSTSYSASYSHSARSCWPRIHLVRNNLPGNFAFRFDQLPDGNDSTPVLVNFSMNAVSLLSFELTSLLDSGGTLALEMILPKTINITEKNVSVSVCLEHLVRPKLDLYNGSCLSPMTVSVNTSSFKSRFGTFLLPFPQSGRWYLSLSASCYLSQLNNDTGEIDSASVPCDDNHTSVFLQIKSSACILGQCGSYGNCYQYISGNFIYSTCVCGGGWLGWGCTDNSKAISNSILLTAVLLLTLSNIFFLPAVILAIRRKYYTEAVVYLATMFFSTMYHACDSEIFYYCMLKLSVLQFCDFYSAILSVWVTLIAMAQIPANYPFQSLAHMMGAIGVAVGVEYDRTGLWVFIIPVSLGVLVILISWTNHCRGLRHCYPRGRVWLFCLLPGVVTAGVGLALYTFLETRSNYQYVHSGWHICMAICILFLLPEKRKDEAKGCYIWKAYIFGTMFFFFPMGIVFLITVPARWLIPVAIVAFFSFGFVSWEDNGNVNCNSYVRVEGINEVPTLTSREEGNSDEQLLPETLSHLVS